MPCEREKEKKSNQEKKKKKDYRTSRIFIGHYSVIPLSFGHRECLEYSTCIGTGWRTKASIFCQQGVQEC